MITIRTRVFASAAAALAIGFYAQTAKPADKETPKDPADQAVAKGLKWLASVQGKDGGWGQDGGETTYVRQNERLESTGNDVANTAVAALSMLHAGTTPKSGEYREQVLHATEFVLAHVENAPADGLAVTDHQGTQIQRKLGPYIDTFLTAKLLAELDGAMPDAKWNSRVRTALQKCVAKIEKAQLKDGSWNIAGGWAPILGTSMASQSLYVAQQKGAANPTVAMARAKTYTAMSMEPPPVAGMGAGVAGGVPSGSGGGVGSGRGAGVGPSTASTVTVSAAAPAAYGAAIGGIGPPSSVATPRSYGLSAVSAGVPLYKRAQELEELTRTDKDRKENEKQIAAITGQLSDQRFIAGFGSVGGEEFFSYLNISESLHRAGGPEWKKWNGEMASKLLSMQNADGTWAGQHCITGRVAVTSAAILLLRADRDPAQGVTVEPVAAKKK